MYCVTALYLCKGMRYDLYLEGAARFLWLCGVFEESGSAKERTDRMYRAKLRVKLGTVL